MSLPKFGGAELARILEVPCGSCAGVPGSKCRSRAGDTVPPHAARVKAAGLGLVVNRVRPSRL